MIQKDPPVITKAQIRLAEVLRMKEKLMSNANLRNLIYESLDNQAKLVDGLKKVEVAAMIDQAQQLDTQIIPAIIRKHGDQSAEARFWKGVLDTIVWAMYLVDHSDSLNRQLIRTQHMLGYYQNYDRELQQELNYYTTLERFITEDQLKKAIQNETDSF
jgi:hypothetical protein